MTSPQAIVLELHQLNLALAEEPRPRQGTSYVLREGTKRLDVHRVRGELSAQGNLGYRRIAEGDELVLRQPVGLVRHLGFKST
jgi:hypothetical protein